MERVLAALEACVLDTFLPQALPRACPLAAAATALADALAAAKDAPQAAMLGRMQVLYEQNSRYALRFGFVRGIYACMEQCFVPQAPQDPFETHVHQTLMTLPGMREEPVYWQYRNEIMTIMASLTETLPAERVPDLVELDSLWDAREYAALWQSFYVGYQASLAILETITPAACQHARETLARFETIFAPQFPPSAFSFRKEKVAKES